MRRTRKTNHPADVQDDGSTPNPRFWREFLINIVAHIIAPIVLSTASIVWLYFAYPIIPHWPFLIFIILTIVLVYLSLISLQFFFRNDFKLTRRKSLHLALIAMLIVTVTAPLAIVLSYVNSRSANEKRLIRLYSLVTRPMSNVLRKEAIDSDDFQDLLNSCLVSIDLSQRQRYELRATVVYLDKTGSYLVVPLKGYYGTGFDKGMQDLYFSVAPMRPTEKDIDYRKRVGVAGRAFLDRKEIIDDNVQIARQEYVYRPYPGSSQDQPDAAMICVPILDLNEGNDKGNDKVIGVLSISSPTPAIFEANDIAVARFYATLLGKFKAVLEPPAAEAQKIGNSEATVTPKN